MRVLIYLCFCLFLPVMLASGQQRPWEKFGINLTAEETAWLSAHPVVKVGLDPQWPPFSKKNQQGVTEGIDIDFLAKLEQRLGIRFEIANTQSWAESYQLLREGKLDMTSGISPSEEREKFLLFTQSYERTPVAIVTRVDGPFMTDLSVLKSVTVACPKSFVTTEQLKRDYPHFKFIETETLKEAMLLTSSGKADLIVERLPSLSYLIRQQGLTNLKIAGVTDYRFDLHMAIPKDRPLLHSILDKGLSSISTRERSEILAQWIYVGCEYPNALHRYANWILAGAAASLLALLGFLFWNQRLKREVKQRMIAESELRQLSNEKSKFMNMAAHDINNPLTIIMMYCEMAIAKTPKVPGEEASNYENIQKHAMRISHLIQNLLNSGNIEQGVKRMRPQEMNLNLAVKKVLAGYTPLAAKKQITLTLEPAKNLPEVWADPSAVAQVLENVISNAVKFSPPDSRVEVALRQSAGFLEVAVKDTGPGISEADRPQLFGKFSRLSNLPTGSETSHGLGLFIVKELMEEMKGKVWVDKLSDAGATFIAAFPLAKS
jgi:two-component system, NarL family, sensor histidine kinase EvgS